MYYVFLYLFMKIWKVSNQVKWHFQFQFQNYFLKNTFSIADIEFIEKKAFEVCDTDDDGGLSWPEVKICEVCM